MKYFYTLLAFVFGVSLMLSVAHAGQKASNSPDQQIQKRQKARSVCIEHKSKQKQLRKCQAQKTVPER